jgi:transcriptional regulator with XRE-family HTH domain
VDCVNDQESFEVGSQLRTLRQQRGLSLRALAGLCDLSPNTISLIERGISSPSVSTLHRLATALRVPITAFFERQEDKVEVVLLRAGERSRSGSASVSLESLGTGLEAQTLEPFVVTLNPGAGSGRHTMIHMGHELVYCLQGKVEYQVGDQSCLLGEGDSLIFEANLPHRWRNPGTEPAVFLLVFQSAVAGKSVEQHLNP